MKQKAHAWIALRAVAALKQDPEAAELVGLLRPHLAEAALGAWLPDVKFFKAGTGSTQNHVLKMQEVTGPGSERFVVGRAQLIKALGRHREVTRLLADPALPEEFWRKAWQGQCSRGDHPANCAMGLATTLIDLLLLGDRQTRKHCKKTLTARVDFPDGAETRELQAAVYFFMLSHFIADSEMPCHADARKLASYETTLHAQWEEHLDSLLAGFPEPGELAGHTPAQLLRRAERALPLDLPPTIPRLSAGGDIWTEVIMLCRAAFAVNVLVAPLEAYPPGSTRRPTFEQLFPGGAADERLATVSHAILHDAVLSVAMVWKALWGRVSGEG